MASTLLIGNSESVLGFVEEYSNTHNILPYEIERFEEMLPIASARDIKKKLSFSTPGSRLFIFLSGMTIEAQNALLKSVEESSDNTHFIFCCEREDSILPTIASRSRIVKIREALATEEQMYGVLSKIITNTSVSYSDIEEIASLCEKDFGKIIVALRQIVLDETMRSEARLRAAAFCKKLLQMNTLLKQSNVSVFVLLESAFEPASTT